MTRRRSPMRLLRTILINLLFLAVLAGAGYGGLKLLTGRGPTAADNAGPNASPVRVMAVRRQTAYTLRPVFSGRVATARSSNIGFERSGLLSAVLVDDGDKVKKDQVIARLDVRKLTNAKRQLAAELAEVEAQLTSARIKQQRSRMLLDQGHGSRATFDDAKYAVDALAARRLRIRTSIESIEIDLRKSVLRAPFGGLVASRKADEGTVVAAGQAIVTLHESGRLEARIGVPADLARAVAVGTEVTVTIGGRKRAGMITAVAPSMTMATQTVDAIVTLAPGAYVPAGQVVRLHLTRRADQPGFWVPLTALTEGLRGLWKVYVATRIEDGAPADARLVRKEVEILHVDGRRAYVRGTLQDRDRVVANGVHKLVPGQRVKVLANAAAAGVQN